MNYFCDLHYKGEVETCTVSKLPMKNLSIKYYTIMDLLPVEYAVMLTRKSDVDRGE
jgi:hypothetical protein